MLTCLRLILFWSPSLIGGGFSVSVSNVETATGATKRLPSDQPHFETFDKRWIVFPFQDRKNGVHWAPIDVIWLTSMWALALISVLCLHRSLPHWQLFHSSLKRVLSRWITDLDAWHFPATEVSRAGDQSPNESPEEVSWRYKLFKWDTNRRGLCYCWAPYDNVLIWI